MLPARISVHAWFTTALIGLAALGFALAILLEARTDTEARVASGRPLRVGYALEAPYAMLDERNQVIGEAPAVFNAALREAGLPPAVWVHADFGNLLDELESGRIDVIAAGMFITPERGKRVLFSRPTARVDSGLLVRRGQAPLARYIDFLRGPKLGVLRNSVEETRARRAGLDERQLRVYPDPATAIAALRAREIDALALSSVSVNYLAAHDADAALDALPGFDTQAGAAGLPAFQWRHDAAALQRRVDLALEHYLGSPEHLAAVRGYGFDETHILPVSAAAKAPADDTPAPTAPTSTAR